jgi:hypothetical protein
LFAVWHLMPGVSIDTFLTAPRIRLNLPTQKRG